MSRLSKARNGHAHPDRSLAREVVAVLRGAQDIGLGKRLEDDASVADPESTGDESGVQQQMAAPLKTENPGEEPIKEHDQYEAESTYGGTTASSAEDMKENQDISSGKPLPKPIRAMSAQEVEDHLDVMMAGPEPQGHDKAKIFQLFARQEQLQLRAAAAN